MTKHVIIITAALGVILGYAAVNTLVNSTGSTVGGVFQKAVNLGNSLSSNPTPTN